MNVEIKVDGKKKYNGEADVFVAFVTPDGKESTTIGRGTGYQVVNSGLNLLRNLCVEVGVNFIEVLKSVCENAEKENVDA